MFVFSSIDCFEITGRGFVYTVLLPETVNNFDKLIGKEMYIDNNIRTCIGVERFGHTPPWKKGEPIGILVKEKI